jgi:hypothetical protein
MRDLQIAVPDVIPTLVHPKNPVLPVIAGSKVVMALEASSCEVVAVDDMTWIEPIGMRHLSNSQAMQISRWNLCSIGEHS